MSEKIEEETFRKVIVDWLEGTVICKIEVI